MIITQVQDRIATLTLNRPDKLNALNAELLSGSIDILRTWSADPNVGAIVVTGAGRAFCAGGDVSAMAQSTEQSLEQSIDRSLRVADEPAADPCSAVVDVGVPPWPGRSRVAERQQVHFSRHGCESTER